MNILSIFFVALLSLQQTPNKKPNKPNPQEKPGGHYPQYTPPSSQDAIYNKEGEAKQDPQSTLGKAADEAKEVFIDAAKSTANAISKVTDGKAKLQKDLDNLLEQMGKNPLDHSIQIKFCDAMLQFIDELIATAEATKVDDLIQKRDRVIKILTELSTTLGERSKQTATKAQQATDKTKGFYETLQETESKISRGYLAQVDAYRGLKFEDNTKDIGSWIEALQWGRQTISLVRENVGAVAQDSKDLEQLKSLSMEMTRLQQLFYEFGNKLQESIKAINDNRELN